MMNVKLPPRLAAIAALVPPGTRLADVGTDHALLPAWLLQQGRAVWAVATDINEAPLARAKQNAANWGLRALDFRLCDGLAAVSGQEVDTVVIAGLGGDKIAEIVENAPWLRKEHTLLLQPMSRGERLRHYLLGNGYVIEQETLVEDTGRVYSVLLVHGGHSEQEYTAAEYYTGRYDHVAAQPLFVRLLSQQLRRAEGAVAGLLRSQKQGAAALLTQQRALLTALESMKGKYDHENQ